MLSSLECLPCFLKQTLYTARLSTSDEKLHHEILCEVSRLLPGLDLDKTPPENSMPIYAAISQRSGCPDPFAQLKKESNQFAARFVEASRPLIKQAKDPLFTALLFSIAGNIIDYGSQQDFDAQAALEQCLAKELRLNHYPALQHAFKSSNHILYLVDNAGEIVFDKLVIETMLSLAPEKNIVVAVKDGPIINDALLADAEECGLNEICQVISNGVSCPGTPIELCSPEFLEQFNQAELIISKGQGNFETLSQVAGPIFFLLTIKCGLVGRHLQELMGQDIAMGDMVLCQREKQLPVDS